MGKKDTDKSSGGTDLVLEGEGEPVEERKVESISGAVERLRGGGGAAPAPKEASAEANPKPIFFYVVRTALSDGTVHTEVYSAEWPPKELGDRVRSKAWLPFLDGVLKLTGEYHDVISVKPYPVLLQSALAAQAQAAGGLDGWTAWAVLTQWEESVSQGAGGEDDDVDDGDDDESDHQQQRGSYRQSPFQGRKG